MRRRARVDDNQREIVSALRRAGAVVAVTSALGKGFPDIVFAHPNLMGAQLVEIKDGSKPKSAQALTPDEQVFHAEWAHAGCTVHVIRSASEALTLLGRE